MANYRTDAPVIDGIIRLEIEEGRLQYRCRKDDLIVERVVIGIYRLWRHAPFVTVDRGTNFGKVELLSEGCNRF